MPKTKEQNEKIKEERMKTILDSALYLFAVRGYNGVTSDDVTKKAECSHGLLYHYFGSKEDLFNYLIDNIVVVEGRKILSEVNFDQKPKFFIQDSLDAILKALKSERDDLACVIYLALNLHLQKQYLTSIKAKKTKSFYTCLEEAIDEGKREGYFYNNNTKEMIVATLSLIKGLAYTRINLGYKRFTCPKSEIIMRMLIKGGPQC